MALRPAPIGAMLAAMPTEPRPLVAILRYIANWPNGEPTRSVDIPGLKAAGCRACIEWLTHCGLIEASVAGSDCIVRSITEAGDAILAKTGAVRAH